MSSGSYIYGGSYNHGFLHLGFLDPRVLMFRGSSIQGFLGPTIQGFMLHSGVLHPSVYHCLTFRGLTFRVLRSRGLTSRGCYIQGSSTLISCLLGNGVKSLGPKC